MNYKEFMKAVDKKLSVMSEREKTEWIHDIARTTKENKRVSFLNSLNKEHDYCPIIDEKKEIEDWCREIENEEVYFECSSYEEYGESYWDNDYVYDYYDTFEIGKNLSKAFQIAEDLLYQKEYEQALALYNHLFSMSFSVVDKGYGRMERTELRGDFR